MRFAQGRAHEDFIAGNNGHNSEITGRSATGNRSSSATSGLWKSCDFLSQAGEEANPNCANWFLERKTNSKMRTEIKLNLPTIYKVNSVGENRWHFIGLIRKPTFQPNQFKSRKETYEFNSLPNPNFRDVAVA